MTIENMEPEQPKEQTPEEQRAARIRSMRSIANGLVIHSSRFLGTMDIGDLHPVTFADFVRLAREIHAEADSMEPGALAERRQKYLETIANDD
jgi:hypothetical protein